jgi:hypothetical protein
MTPLQPIVAELLTCLDDNLKEAFQERAGIMEFDAGMSRELAECLAMLDTLRVNPFSLTGVSALMLRRGAGGVFVLTATAGSAQRQLLGDFRLAGPNELADVLKLLGGTARLTRFPTAPEN